MRMAGHDTVAFRRPLAPIWQWLSGNGFWAEADLLPDGAERIRGRPKVSCASIHRIQVALEGCICKDATADFCFGKFSKEVD